MNNKLKLIRTRVLIAIAMHQLTLYGVHPDDEDAWNEIMDSDESTLDDICPNRDMVAIAKWMSGEDLFEESDIIGKGS